MSSKKILNYIDILDLRKSIDLLDSAFLSLFSERIRIITKVGLVKRHFSLDFSQSKLRKNDFEKIVKIAIERNLRESFILKLYDFIYSQALNTIRNRLEDPNPILSFNHFSNGPEDLLNDLRSSIYNIDVSICHLLAERLRLVIKIGWYKKNLKVPHPLATDRWDQLLSDKLNIASALNISIDTVKELFNIIHEESLALQSVILNSESQN